MKYRYYTCDVFTETRFGGNQLAVLPKAEGLSDQQMQQITREFNYSETSFVLSPEAGQTRKVRIFTPAREIPFAGHPNVGTAFVLASTGEFGQIQSSQTVTFEEKAGLVPIGIQATNGRVTSCELTAPQEFSIGQSVSAELVAAAVCLQQNDLVTKAHPPQVASAGLPFLFAEVKDLSALERSRVNMAGFEGLRDRLSEGNGSALGSIRASVYLYARTEKDSTLQARMFAPLSGVFEDPATGSAACAIAGLLSHLDERTSGEFAWRIAQGVEMGRPSALCARAMKTDGVVRKMFVGGACVLVSEGLIEVE